MGALMTKAEHRHTPDAHAGHGAPMVRDMLRRFIGSAILTVPIVLFSPLGTSLFRRELAPPFGLSHGLLGFVLTSIVVWWGEPFYDAAAMLTAFSLLGHWMEMRSRFATGQAVEALLNLAPPTARRVRDGQEEEVPLDVVAAGDVLAVRPGDTIPVYGIVTAGS